MLRRVRIKLASLGIKQARRVVVFLVGMTVLLFGIALIVLPGPAILVIPAGLAILGLEFRWARRWLRQGRTALRTGRVRFWRTRRKAQNSGCGEASDEAVKRRRNPSGRSLEKPEPVLK
jgi:uncharacterized protein (TIGR02611 family)